MIRIRLHDHVGTGLIIECKSGITFFTQTGGKSCGWAELEGVFVPVANDLALDGVLISPEWALSKHFSGPPHFHNYVGGLAESEAVIIEAALHQNLLQRNVTVDRERLSESHEAWVYVIIDQPELAYPLFEGIGPFPLRGVLTWTNNS